MLIQDIKNIADVIAGYTFRVALESRANGKMTVVQSKDVLDDLYINNGHLIKVDLQEYQTRAMIEENDVVVSSRGSFRASVIKGDIGNMIASSSVYVLRIKNKSITPEYLAIYLNSMAGQKKIKEKITGAVIKTILRRDLENLKIPVPGQGIQKKIINLHKNNRDQQELLTRKKTLIRQITEGSILNFLK